MSPSPFYAGTLAAMNLCGYPQLLRVHFQKRAPHRPPSSFPVCMFCLSPFPGDSWALEGCVIKMLHWKLAEHSIVTYTQHCGQVWASTLKAPTEKIRFSGQGWEQTRSVRINRYLEGSTRGPMTSQDLTRFTILCMHSKKVNFERKIESWRPICKYGKCMENMDNILFGVFPFQ